MKNAYGFSNDKYLTETAIVKTPAGEALSNQIKKDKLQIR